MRERPVKPLAPRRKDLPCDFRVAKAARSRAMLGAVVGAALGLLLLWASVGMWTSSVSNGVVFAGIGLVMLAGAWFLADSAFVTVRMDEDGLLVRRLGRVLGVRWDEMGRIEFGASLTRRGPVGRGIGDLAVSIAVQAAANYMEDARAEDPYFNGRVRQQYEPSARVCDMSGRRIESFSDTLGWGMFMALYAEADARGIAIVRTS